MSGALAALSGAGGLSGTVSLSNQSPADSVSSGTATASYDLRVTGDARVNGSNVEVYATPSDIVAGLEALVTMVDGSLTSGTVGSWVALSSNQSWSLQNSTLHSIQTAQATVEIRDAATGFVRASATLDFTAEVL